VAGMAELEEKYVTKNYFLHWRNYSVAGYIILAISCVAGIYGLSYRFEKDLRNDIKHAAVTQCKEFVIPAIENFNEKVNVDIENFNSNFAIDQKTINRYKRLLIPTLTVEECVDQLNL
jgi:hypothetical protein